MDIKRFGVPIRLFDFEQSDINPHAITSKLRVFYVGETPDGRVFNKDFSDKLIQTLPWAPIVAFYDDESEDFVGHNYKQFMYGLVDPLSEVEYITDEDGNEWAQCNCYLYNKRDDIGYVAEQIPGKSQSLELNPDTVKYEVVKDGYGKIKNIIFKEGELIGLSVLGDDQKPAFTGSGFDNFEIEEDEKKEQFKIAVFEYLTNSAKDFENFIEDTYNKNEEFGGVEMNFEEFLLSLGDNSEKYLEFMQKSHQEQAQEVVEAISKHLEHGNFWPIQTFNDHVIVMNFEEDAMLRYDYMISDNEYVFGSGIPVYTRYLTQSQIDSLTSMADFEEEQIDEEPAAVDEMAEAVEDNEEDNSSDQEDFQVFEEDTPEASTDVNDSNENVDQASLNEDPSEDQEGVNDEENFEEIEEPQEEEQEEQDSNFAASVESPEREGEDRTSVLTDAERLELEEFRREKKLKTIDKYRKQLSKDTYDDLIVNVNNYSQKELLTEIALKALQYSELMADEEEEEADTTVKVFNTDIGGSRKERTLQDLVDRYKDKK